MKEYCQLFWLALNCFFEGFSRNHTAIPQCEFTESTRYPHKKNKVNLSHPLRDWKVLGESLKSDERVHLTCSPCASLPCADPAVRAQPSPRQDCHDEHNLYCKRCWRWQRTWFRAGTVFYIFSSAVPMQVWGSSKQELSVCRNISW